MLSIDINSKRLVSFEKSQIIFINASVPILTLNNVILDLFSALQLGLLHASGCANAQDNTVSKGSACVCVCVCSSAYTNEYYKY